MSIRVTEDESQIGGYALIELGSSITPTHLSYRRQDAEPRHLGLDGWQPEIAWLAPLATKRVEGKTVLQVGPEIVDQIEELVPVEIVANGEISLGLVSWPALTPFPSSGEIRLHGIARSADRLVSPSAEAAPAVAPVVASSLEIAKVTPVAEAAPQSLANVPTVPKAKAGRRLALPLAAVLIVAGASAVGWHSTRPSATNRNVQEAGPERISPDDARRRYDVLIRTGANPSEFLSLGREAVDAGQGTLAFRAFEEADPAANADAAWHLARFHDPRVVEQVYRDAARPNVARAAFYYALWRGQSPRHAEELRSLCQAYSELASRDEPLKASCR